MKRAVIAIATGVVLAGCGSTQQPTPAAPAPVEAKAASQPAAAGPLGTVGHDAGVDITVQSVKYAKTTPVRVGYGDPTVAQYGFVIADVVERNNGAEMVQPGGFEIAAPDGSRYPATVEPEFDPEIVQSGQGPLQPGGLIRGHVVFDAPVQHGTIVYETDGANVPVYSWTF